MRICVLTTSIDVEVTKKFDAADAAFKAQTLGTQQALEHTIGELTAAWSHVDSGNVKSLAEALEAKTAEDKARLQHVKDTLEKTFDDFSFGFNPEGGNKVHLESWKV